MKAPPSTTPAPGDGLLGCVHKPDPHSSHVFWMTEPFSFRRPDGSIGEAIAEDAQAHFVGRGMRPKWKRRAR